MRIDARFVILWNFELLKNVRGSFCEIRAIVLKLHTNILYRSKNFGIEFGQNRLNRSNFKILNFTRMFSKLCNSGKF